jgi:L-threonylcarbamoyladenylate synthase
VRSHDQNRLLDEPGQTYLSSENIFFRHMAREGPWGKPSPTVTTIQTFIAVRAKVRLMDAPALQKALDVLGSELDLSAKSTAGGPCMAVYARTPLKSRSAQVLIRRMPDDAAATAQQLFAVLREFDAQGVQLIWIETLPEAPEWDGVRDRLQRASAS